MEFQAVRSTSHQMTVVIDCSTCLDDNNYTLSAFYSLFIPCQVPFNLFEAAQYFYTTHLIVNVKYQVDVMSTKFIPNETFSES